MRKETIWKERLTKDIRNLGNIYRVNKTEMLKIVNNIKFDEDVLDEKVED